MAHLLVLYASKTGQTRKIATRIAERLRRGGNVVHLFDARHPPTPELLAKIDGVVIGSWVRGGKHMACVRRFVTHNHPLLSRVPSAFYSVSLLQLSTRADSRKRAAEYVTRFLDTTGWQPRLSVTFAGAIRYTHFGWFGKRIERMIWRREGLDTDIENDHEYTRWDDVDRFADTFGGLLPARRRERLVSGSQLRRAS